MRILVTGASGYVGSEFVRSFFSLGDELITTDCRGDVDFLGDLTDSAFVGRLPEVEAVVHLASIQYFSPGLPSLGRGRYIIRNNQAMAANLAARYGASVRLVAVGSSMQYGPGVIDSRRRGQFVNSGPYSESKNLCYQILEKAFSNFCWLVPPVIVDSDRGGIVASLGKFASRFKVFPVISGGATSISVIHRQDIVKYLVAAVNSSIFGVIHCSSVDRLSFSSLASRIGSERGNSIVSVLPLHRKFVAVVSWVSFRLLLAKEQLGLVSSTQVLVSDSLPPFSFELKTRADVIDELVSSWR